jgi:hypothetical protein
MITCRSVTVRLVCLLVLGMGGPIACSKSGRVAERPSGLPASSVSSEATPVIQPPPPTATAVPSGSPGSDVESVPAPPDPRTTIGGTISVPAARRKDLAKTDTLFIIARRAGAPPGPGSMIAVQRHAVGDFPMPFTLSGRDSMLPGKAFQGKIDVTVRVDKDGDGMTRRKGDLFGHVKNVPVGTLDLAVSVDSVQTEDETLPGIPASDGRPTGRPPAVHP